MMNVFQFWNKIWTTVNTFLNERTQLISTSSPEGIRKRARYKELGKSQIISYVPPKEAEML